ncbi:MAG: antitoxin VapB family protein [Candidatus Micrarchaeota archaeon]
MAFKNITVSVEAYAKLKSLQKMGESFSKTIIRISGKRKAMDVAGILTAEEGQALQKGVDELRRKTKVREWH